MIMNMNHSDPYTIYQSTLYNIPEDLNTICILTLMKRVALKNRWSYTSVTSMRSKKAELQFHFHFFINCNTRGSRATNRPWKLLKQTLFTTFW
jgi:hypothetical protein